MLSLSRRGVSPVIAIVLLLMMTVAAAGAAYFWLTQMQSSMQESSRKSIENIMEASGRRVTAQATLCKPTYPYKGLKAYWTFEEGSGNKTKDVSGNGNTGTLYPGPDGSITSDSGMWTNGQISGSLKFDGNDSQVVVDKDISDRFGGKITVTWWGKGGGDFNGLYVCSDGLGGGFSFYTGSPRFLITNETGDYNYTSGGSIEDDKWHFIVGVYDKTLPEDNIKLYIDGDLVGTANFQYDLKNWNDIGIGGDADTLYRQVNGTIDEVRLYDRALSKNEIKELYEAENHSARRRIDVTVRNIGSKKVPKATWVANLKQDGTNVETDAYNASAIDTGELSTLKFYFKDFKPNTEYTIDLQGTGTSTTVSC